MDWGHAPGDNIMRTIVLMTMLCLASAPLAAAATDEGSNDGDDQCVNYGNQVQWNVLGDNTYECQAQQCVNGGSGAGSAGVGAGTAGGSGNAGASASAGTGCKQEMGSEPSEPSSGPIGR